VSRHHILPPIVYTPAPPKSKKTERRRGVGNLKGKGATGETEETEEASEVSHTAPAAGAAALPQHSRPVEATERRLHSTTSKLSEDTLKAMLEAQEQQGGPDAGSASPVKKG
jgi:hypothetical protein